MQSLHFKKIKLPNKPGVYFFLGPPKRGEGGLKGKEILYIGKATSLKDRVKSYFGKDLIETRGPLLVDMVFQAEKIKWQETDSVLEAIILEANLIKKHQPKYNTKEKSDKSFNYVCITKEKLPKVVVVRGKNLAEQEFSRVLGFPGPRTPARPAPKPLFSSIFGPYTSGSQLREAIKIIRRIFPFLDDKSKNYLEFYKQINLVSDLGDRKLYLQNIRNIKLFFEGKKKQILRNLQKEMKIYAKAREFEKAGEIKRQIFALQHINDVALLKQENFSRSSLLGVPSGSHTNKNFPAFSARIEAYDIAHMGGKNMVGVMTVVEDGEPAKSEYKKFKIRTQTDANDTGALKEVLERRLKHTEWAYPSLIVVDGSIAQINVAEKIIQKMGLEIDVVGVVKDDRHKAKAIQGKESIIKKYKSSILLGNSEAHRFAIAYHKKMRNRNFLI